MDIFEALNQLNETDIAQKDDVVTAKYWANSYYDKSLRGLEDNIESNNLDSVIDFVWNKYSNGFEIEAGNREASRYVRIKQGDFDLEYDDTAPESIKDLIISSLFVKSEMNESDSTSKVELKSDEGKMDIKKDKDGNIISINGKIVLRYDNKHKAFIVPKDMKDFWDEL